MPSKSKKCPSGKIRRSGFTSRSGKRVPSKCIKAQGEAHEFRGKVYKSRKAWAKAVVSAKTRQHKRVASLYGRPRCPRGTEPREGYVRSAYRRKSGSRVRGAKVPAGCIKIRGKTRGKSALKGKIPLEKNVLRPFGYSSTKRSASRHHALEKAVDAGHKPLSTYRRLVYLATLNKNTNPSKSRLYKADAEWLEKHYKVGKYKGGRRAKKTQEGGRKRRKHRKARSRSRSRSRARKSQDGGKRRRKHRKSRSRSRSRKHGGCIGSLDPLSTALGLGVGSLGTYYVTKKDGGRRRRKARSRSRSRSRKHGGAFDPLSAALGLGVGSLGTYYLTGDKKSKKEEVKEKAWGEREGMPVYYSDGGKRRRRSRTRKPKKSQDGGKRRRKARSRSRSRSRARKHGGTFAFDPLSAALGLGVGSLGAYYLTGDKKPKKEEAKKSALEEMPFYHSETVEGGRRRRKHRSRSRSKSRRPRKSMDGGRKRRKARSRRPRKSMDGGRKRRKARSRSRSRSRRPKKSMDGGKRRKKRSSSRSRSRTRRSRKN